MAYANAALAAGDRVALTARRPDELAEWAQRHGERVMVLPLDVTDRGQVQQAVGAAEERFGGIDVLVNNAGRGWYGSAEGTPEDTVRRTFDLNFFGAVDVIRAVLPGMRERGSGWIVTMSSVAGLMGITGFGYYSAAKFAMEGLTEALRREVEPLGIKVLAVEPGAFRTNAYAGFEDEPIGETIEAYQPMLAGIRAAFVADNGKQAGDPDRGAHAVIEAMNSANPPERLVLGNAGYDAATAKLEATLAELRAHEKLSRGADFD